MDDVLSVAGALGGVAVAILTLVMGLSGATRSRRLDRRLARVRTIKAGLSGGEQRFFAARKLPW